MKTVAAIHQINANAASMRLTRLKKALGSLSEKNCGGDDGGTSAAGENLKSPKTPKTKASKVDSIGSPATTGSGVGVSTPSPVVKGKGNGKKRKLNEEDQVNSLIQRAGIEVLTRTDVNPQTETNQLRDVMIQTKDEGLMAECERKLLALKDRLTQ